MTASEVFESVTGSGSSDFAVLVDALNTHGPWCLIGGLAVNCYVEPVYTLDADTIVVSSEVPTIKQELVEKGFSIHEFPHSMNARMAVAICAFSLVSIRATRISWARRWSARFSANKSRWHHSPTSFEGRSGSGATNRDDLLNVRKMNSI